jgi:hypothetical protein
MFVPCAIFMNLLGSDWSSFMLSTINVTNLTIAHKQTLNKPGKTHFSNFTWLFVFWHNFGLMQYVCIWIGIVV